MKRIARGLAAGLVAAAGILLVPSAASADTSDFSFESFHGDYTISRGADGFSEVRVVETLVAVFPDYDQNRGIIRAIPRYYNDAPLDISDVRVADEHGSAVSFESNDVSYGDGTDNEFVELALGTDEYVHGRTTYVISYTAHNAVGAFGDGTDEFYWDINGTGWAQTFGEVSATVRVDSELAGALNGDNSCYYGSYESTSRCTIDSDGSTVTASATDLGAYENLTVDVGFEPGTFVQPELARNSWIVTIAPLVLLFAALALLVAAMVLRFGFWRDATGRGIVIAQYTVPDDRDLLRAGDLVERETTALPAQFVDLAVRGFVQIVDLHPGASDFETTDRFVLDLVTTEGATEAETTILNILFGGSNDAGSRVHLSRLPASVGASLFAQGAKARRASIGDRLRAQPAGSLGTWLLRAGVAIFAAYVVIVIWTYANDVDGSAVFGFGVTATVILLIVGGLLSKPYLLTDSGADARDYLRGLREYLALAEADRLRVLQSPQGADRVVTTDKRAIVKLHEKLLPYAVLWGVEKEWASQLAVEYTAVAENPAWMSSDIASVDFGNFVSSFSRSSLASVRPIVTSSSSGGGGGSSWSSSGGSSFSSGSGGGGFSGGGGGGGGGGGR